MTIIGILDFSALCFGLKSYLRKAIKWSSTYVSFWFLELITCGMSRFSLEVQKTMAKQSYEVG